LTKSLSKVSSNVISAYENGPAGRQLITMGL
jgi:hypothetical protein